jgi:hypothetical protein
VQTQNPIERMVDDRNTGRLRSDRGEAPRSPKTLSLSSVRDNAVFTAAMMALPAAIAACAW